MVAIDVSDRLLEVLRSAAERPELAYTRAPQPLTGGFWAELWQFSVARAPDGWPGELVARLMPDENMARKETVVQTAVANAGYPTPVVRASGDASSPLGRAFMVMDRAPGAPLLAGLNGIAALARAPRLARRIPDVLASSMAELHALSPTGVVELLRDTTAVATTLPAMLEGLTQAADACRRDDLRAAAEALVRRAHRDDSTVICHGDLHPFNLLVDEHGAVTVLDWSASLVAPRTYDVAFTSLMLSEPPLALPDALRPTVRRIGRSLASRFVRAYEQRTGAAIDTETLAYFQAIVCLRALVEVAFWVTGGVVDQRAGHPWLTSGAALASRLGAVTGIAVRPR